MKISDKELVTESIRALRVLRCYEQADAVERLLQNADEEGIIRSALNDKRSYGCLETDDDEVRTLESVEECATEYLLNGPEGNELVLRLLEIIKKLRK